MRELLHKILGLSVRVIFPLSVPFYFHTAMHSTDHSQWKPINCAHVPISAPRNVHGIGSVSYK